MKFPLNLFYKTFSFGKDKATNLIEINQKVSKLQLNLQIQKLYTLSHKSVAAVKFFHLKTFYKVH